MSEDVSGVVALIGLALTIGGGVFAFGKLAQRIEDIDKRQNEEIIPSLDELDDEKDKAQADIRELQGKIKLLEQLQTVPQSLTHISGQISSLQVSVTKLDSDLRASQINGATQAKVLENLLFASKDHEERIRNAERKTDRRHDDSEG